ncbi:hypothetical protein MUP77_21560, partial [Candidatus Bathyarchaeota archaeon]|nr:hypothetical protein [Candidatus Bathyarchaeota archaeon]
ENVCEDNVVSLEEAIRKNIKPGMSILFCNIANAAFIYQIMREFRGKKPEFTLICTQRGLELDAVHCGLVKKLITSGFGEARPRPHISYIFRRAYVQKAVDFEVWSATALLQRLLAGALDVKFFTTRFMIGSSMAEEDEDSFKVIDDPFGSGEKVGIVKALNPDIALVHVPACDRSGNALWPGNLAAYQSWFSATQGVLVSTERLVSTEFIRKHSLLTSIPGYLVKAVSVVPFGAHPWSMFNLRINELESYIDDAEFMGDHHEASRYPASLDAWHEKWVYGCPSRDDYLNKLGHDRIALLKKRARTDELQAHQLTSITEKILTGLEYSPIEMMIIATARKIEEIVLRHGYKVLLCGVGIAGVASWLACYRLRDRNYHVEPTVGGSHYGPSPFPGDPFIAGLRLMRSCKMLTDDLTGYSLIICGKKRSSLSILGAAQIDKYGNLNSGKLSEKVYVSGPGGAGDACQASEVLAVLRQSKDRFLDEVPYITSSGKQVKTLVSELGVFEKIADDDEFTLVACLPTYEGHGLEEGVKRVKDNCGWELKVSSEVKILEAPSFDELMATRLLDPDDYFRH